MTFSDLKFLAGFEMSQLKWPLHTPLCYYYLRKPNDHSVAYSILIFQHITEFCFLFFNCFILLILRIVLIFITEQGGTEFVICLDVKGIPENITSLQALFEGVGYVNLTPVTEGVYTGSSPGMLIYNGNRTKWSPIQSVII